MLHWNIEASLMGIGIVAMVTDGVTVGVGVVMSLLHVTWKQLRFQFLNFDLLRVVIRESMFKIPLLE
jgi:hypothetical protein